jgi:hypothetical protein
MSFDCSMRSSLFRSKVPRTVLITLLRDIGRRERNGYAVYDELLRRKGRESSICAFLCAAVTYYYPSKWHYVRRVKDAKSLMAVIRQICKHQGIPISSRTVYQHGCYTIHYKIIIEEPIDNTPKTEPSSP